MVEEHPIHLIVRATGARLAGLARPARSSDKVLWTHWHEWMPADAEDGHWEWDRLIDYPAVLTDRFACFSVEAGAELQGLMLLEFCTESSGHYGVHVSRLSTAPWNRPPERRHQGVGSILMAAAVLRSLADGHEGRVYLESLPDAVPFYRRQGMIPCDTPSPEGLPVFRFTAEAAWEFVLRLEQDGLIHAGS